MDDFSMKLTIVLAIMGIFLMGFCFGIAYEQHQETKPREVCTCSLEDNGMIFLKCTREDRDEKAADSPN